MIFSYKLLKEYVDVEGLSIKDITAKLTLAGFELEGMEQLSSGTNLVIGEVLECEDHPNSDHLHVTKTSIGNEVLQIVCGAPNCRKGLKVIVARVGAELKAMGVEVLLDDRDERAGVKFKDSELIGIPMRITVGKDIVDGKVEFKLRNSDEKQVIGLDEIKSKVEAEFVKNNVKLG